MGQKYYVAHGVGPVETGSHYIRGEIRAERIKYYEWRDMGYLWSYVVGVFDDVNVIHFCRDMESLPNDYWLLKKSYAKAKLIDVDIDVDIENDIPRWLKIFKHIHGETTSKDDGIYRQKELSPACSLLNTTKCTSKDVIKLAHMGLIALDDMFSCLVERVKPKNGNSDVPTYTSDEIVRVEDIVDKFKLTGKTVRTTLRTNPLGGETAIVMILGRVHLIQRKTDQHPWYLVTKIGRGGSTEPVLSYQLEMIFEEIRDSMYPKFEYGYIFGKTVRHPYPWKLGGLGTRHLSGYLDCPENNKFGTN